MKTVLLIDGDTSAFRAALSVEKVIEWEETGIVTKHADTNEAIAAYEAFIKAMVETYEADEYRIALTGQENFRKAILPTYKSKRTEKPMALNAVKRHAVEKMGAVIKPGLEADDVIGIWATHPKLVPGHKIVLSIDKDLRTIPCRLTTGDGVVEEISEHEAALFHMTQTLTGDTTDGYTGCPGVGPKKAAKILAETGIDFGKSWWDAIVETYVKKGLTEEDALVQARVARILRSKDFKFKTKEPILWTPSQSL